MTGKVLQILGPVIDVGFDSHIPKKGDILETFFLLNGEETRLELEVAAILSNGKVRTIALGRFEGLERGQEVKPLV